MATLLPLRKQTRFETPSCPSGAAKVLRKPRVRFSPSFSLVAPLTPPFLFYCSPLVARCRAPAHAVCVAALTASTRIANIERDWSILKRRRVRRAARRAGLCGCVLGAHCRARRPLFNFRSSLAKAHATNRCSPCPPHVLLLSGAARCRREMEAEGAEHPRKKWLSSAASRTMCTTCFSSPLPLALPSHFSSAELKSPHF